MIKECKYIDHPWMQIVFLLLLFIIVELEFFTLSHLPLMLLKYPVNPLGCLLSYLIIASIMII
jgi:hypothetical protein